jgi:HIV Tat-specific factor 1
LIAQQQQAYGPTIVSTNSPPRLHPLDPEASTSKRGLSPSDDPPAKKQKQKKSRPAKDPSAKRETSAIFVTNLPLGEGETTVERLQETFSKAGLIMEDGDGEARVKLYYEKAEEGKRPKFKGEALIVYLQSDSVTLATQLFDDTYLVIGRGTGPGGRDVLADSDGTMKVNKAVWESKASATVKKDAPVVLSGTGIKKVDIEKQKMGKRREKLKA